MNDDALPRGGVNTGLDFAILDVFSDPLILVDAERRVVAANWAATEVLGASGDGNNLIFAVRDPALLSATDAVLAGGDGETVDLRIEVPVACIYRVRVASIRGDVEGAPAAALVFQDITAVQTAENTRADFVANVSHELRSPISSIIGFIETLRGPAREDAEAQERFISMMHEEAHRMARLIDDLLSLSRVEAMEHVRPEERIDVADVVRTTVSLLAERARERGMEIRVTVDEALAAVPGDRDELSEVFNNLIDNAIKYGALRTAVEVRLEPVARIPDVGGAGIAVTVANQGEGIAADHLPRLTERFYRIDKGRSRNLGGTGLGLAIVKHIVNHHRGRLIIDSAPGQGVTVAVYLPSGPGS